MPAELTLEGLRSQIRDHVEHLDPVEQAQADELYRRHRMPYEAAVEILMRCGQEGFSRVIAFLELHGVPYPAIVIEVDWFGEIVALELAPKPEVRVQDKLDAYAEDMRHVSREARRQRRIESGFPSR